MAKTHKITRHNYSKDDLIDILDKVIPIYESESIISFHRLLEKHCTYKETNWQYWLFNKKDPDITDRFNILRDIQTQKIIEGAFNGDINSTFSIFFLKSKRGWVEQQHRDRLELDRERLTMDKETIDDDINIRIGFAEDEDEA